MALLSHPMSKSSTELAGHIDLMNKDRLLLVIVSTSGPQSLPGTGHDTRLRRPWLADSASEGDPP